MNTTKKVLIILAIIFSFGSVALDIFDIVQFFRSYSSVTPIFYVVYYFISIIASLAVAVLLIISIWGNGKYFRQRYGLYMTALVLSIIINFLSVSTILLIATMFISDWVWIKPDKDDTIIIPHEKSKEEKVAELRQRFSDGEISYEEFQQELTKLL